jgi:hypothetical protein
MLEKLTKVQLLTAHWLAKEGIGNYMSKKELYGNFYSGKDASMYQIYDPFKGKK